MFEDPTKDPILPNESGPNLLTRDEMVGMLRDRGINDPEVKEHLIQYQITLEHLTYTAESGQDENPRLAIHMAKIYFEANYIEYAIESLKELLDLNLSDEVLDEVYDALDMMENND